MPLPSNRFPRSPLLLLLSVLIGAFLLGLKQVTDVDALLHLSMGKLFVATRTFPMNEPFCYPAAETPFLYTSWFFATASYLIFQWFGAVSLSIGIALAVVLLAWLLYRDAHLLTDRNHGVVATLLIGCALLLAEDRFVLRPEIIQYMAFAAVTWLLGRLVFERQRAWLWWIPVISLLWGNSHSSVILLFVPFGSFAAYLVMEVLKPGEEDGRSRAIQSLKVLSGWGALSLLAALCNPNGVGQFGYGQSVMQSDLYKQMIIELMPPRSKELWVIWPVFGLSVVLSLLALRRRAIPYLLISVASLYIGLSAIRFFAFFCLVQAPIVARCAMILTDRWYERVQRPVIILTAVVVILSLSVLNAGSFYPLERDVISNERFGAGYHIPVDHEEAVAFLHENNIRGRVFNVFEDGQAIIWHGWPDLTVFIDGRGAIPEEMLEAYVKAFGDQAVLAQLQERFGFEVIILRRYEKLEFNPHGSRGGFVHGDWALVYFDRESYVFLRKGGPYQALIERRAFKNIMANADLQSYVEMVQKRPAYVSGLLNDLLRNPPSALSHFDRILIGLCYFQLGDANKALESLAPYRHESKNILLFYGQLLQAAGRNEEAAAVFREGVSRYGSADFEESLNRIKGPN